MNALAHRIETTLTKDGVLTIDHLPFHAGDSVEVIVLPAARPVLEASDRYPLRGSVIAYSDPFTPVGDEDWNALRADGAI